MGDRSSDTQSQFDRSTMNMQPTSLHRFSIETFNKSVANRDANEIQPVQNANEWYKNIFRFETKKLLVIISSLITTRRSLASTKGSSNIVRRNRQQQQKYIPLKKTAEELLMDKIEVSRN